MNNQTPTTGRMVQFRDPEINDGKPTAAIITGVNDDGTISLHYFAPNGHGGVANVPADDVTTGKPGEQSRSNRSWRWPDKFAEQHQRDLTGKTLGAGVIGQTRGSHLSDAELADHARSQAIEDAREQKIREKGEGDAEKQGGRAGPGTSEAAKNEGPTQAEQAAQTKAPETPKAPPPHQPAPRNDHGRPGSTSAADKK